jgi:hypothetical protein
MDRAICRRRAVLVSLKPTSLARSAVVFRGGTVPPLPANLLSPDLARNPNAVRISFRRFRCRPCSRTLRSLRIRFSSIERLD